MARSWDDVLDKLSSLIAFKNRADGNNWRDAFENMAVYLQASDTGGRCTSSPSTALGWCMTCCDVLVLQRVDMTEDVKKLRVIHVAGTKGKVCCMY